MEIKITKRQLLEEQNNDMTHNWTYLVYGKIYNDNHTRYRKFKFVVFFDSEDIYDWYEEKDYITQKDVSDYLDELISSNLFYINSYDDTKAFYELCNDTITKYNERI